LGRIGYSITHHHTLHPCLILIVLNASALLTDIDIDIFVNCNWVDTRWQ